MLQTGGSWRQQWQEAAWQRVLCTRQLRRLFPSIAEAPAALLQEFELELDVKEGDASDGEEAMEEAGEQPQQMDQD